MSIVAITGDVHGDYDFLKIQSSKNLKLLTENDYLLICGDFGAIWDGRDTDIELLDWYEDQPYTVLFVDGNHENFNLIYKYPVEDWHGGKIHKIRKNVFHLMRGYLFEIGNKKFFTMGGATSVDKDYRIENFDWWAQEKPTQEEKDFALFNARAAEKVDFIITHCAPSGILSLLNATYKKDEVTDFMEELLDTLDFKKWFFGHYHQDRSLWYKNKDFLALYNDFYYVEV